jgi:hypothetical protein
MGVAAVVTVSNIALMMETLQHAVFDQLGEPCLALVLNVKPALGDACVAPTIDMFNHRRNNHKVPGITD